MNRHLGHMKVNFFSPHLVIALSSMSHVPLENNSVFFLDQKVRNSLKLNSDHIP